MNIGGRSPGRTRPDSNWKGVWDLTNIILALILLSSLVLLGSHLSDARLPGNQQGFGPVQPIAFSHRLHGGELKIPCMYCHHYAAKSRYAGTPAPRLCLNCHRFVQATLGAVRQEEQLAQKEGREPAKVTSTEIQKIYDSLGLALDMTPRSQAKPIQWQRVHRLPDFVYFDHSAHQTAGIDCARCHGPVEFAERISQFEDLSMGWCVNCHREYKGRMAGNRPLNPSTDCSSCHL